MPKWVYDNKTMTMVPQQKRGIDYALTGEGLRITDHDKKVEFVITRNNECRLPGRGMKFDCKLYDTHTARQIAGRVQRIYPQSKYKDWRFFAKGFSDPYDYDIEEQMTSEDKALLRSISESYEPGNVLQYVEHLNEETGTLLNVGHTASTEHNFKDHKRGLKGLIQAAPSAILSFLVCPPAAILALIGAVHRRAEQRWAKAMFNHNRWKDFVAYPAERKKAADEVRKKMAENCKYYYTTLANGEILRVVGCSTLEAKEMIMAIERKEIIERYKKYNDALGNKLFNQNEVNIQPPVKGADNDYIMWVVKFNNGEVCYAFGAPDASDKEQIMKDAVESRKVMVDYYKKIIYHDEDNQEKKKQKHPVGIDTETDNLTDEEKRLFAVPRVDDLLRIDNPASYKIIDESNFKDFTEPTNSAPAWNPEGKPVYRFELGDISTSIGAHTPFMKFTLPLADNVEAKAICVYLSEGTRPFAQIIRNVEIFLNNNSIDVTYYKCETENGDYVYLPVYTKNNGTPSLNQGNNFGIDERNYKEIANKLFECISDAVDEANVPTPKISQTTKKDYASNYKKRNKLTSYGSGEAGIDPDSNGNALDLYKDWLQYMYYQSINSRTEQPIDNNGKQLYKGGTSRPASSNQQNNQGTSGQGNPAPQGQTGQGGQGNVNPQGQSGWSSSSTSYGNTAAGGTP